MRSVKKTHSFDSLKALNDGRFDRRIIQVPQITDEVLDCWIWSGSVNRRTGMPWFWRQDVSGQQIAENARRYAWRRYRGELEREEILVCGCPEKICVNPHHHMKGTRSNIHTMKDEALKRYAALVKGTKYEEPAEEPPPRGYVRWKG